jgi:hypothetical protein
MQAHKHTNTNTNTHTHTGYDPLTVPNRQFPIQQPKVTFTFLKHLWSLGQQTLALDYLQKFAPLIRNNLSLQVKRKKE